MEPAQKNAQDINILVTDVGSYLGSELAKAQVTSGAKVYGVGNSPLLSDLLSSHNFTLLELDLAQPLPSYLPKFQMVFYLNFLKDTQAVFSQIPPPLKNLHTLCQSEKIPLFIVAPISIDPDVLLPLLGTENELMRLVQVGDVYGPGLPVQNIPANELENLLKQAVHTDRIIMEDEGLRIIYPAYTTDVVFALTKLAFAKESHKQAQIISEEPKTALSVAYEIQNAASLVLGKSLGLFFSGPEEHIKPEKPHYVHSQALNFSPKVELTEGIKLTFQSFLEKNSPVKPEEIPRINQILSRVPHPDTSATEKKNRLSLNLTKNIPKISLARSKLKYKYLALIAVLLLFVIVTKTIVDVVFAANSLTQAKNEFYRGDFRAVTAKSNSAHKSFKAASNKTKILLFPFLSLNLGFAQGAQQILTAAEEASQALVYFSQGVEIVTKDLSQVTSKDKRTEDVNVQLAENDFKQAYFLSSLARQKMSNKNFILLKKTKVEENLSLLNQGALAALEFSKLYPVIANSQDPKTYLVLLQNNTELRPGGGFIGNYGLVEFEAGKLKNVMVDDIYTIDGQLKEEIEPPAQLKEKLGIEKFYLRDSNWNLDFNLNSQTARDFFKKETGKDVHGVIAFDLTFMQKFLEKIGPVELDDYQEEITHGNLFERGEYYSEVGFFPGSTQKRDFFGALSRKLINDIVTSISDQNSANRVSWFAFLETALESLNTKHFMVSLDEPTLSSYIKTKSWDNPLPAQSFDLSNEATGTKDFIAIAEANIGANKVNRFLDREVSYEMTVGRDADLIGSLKITYRNKSQAETWPAGKYINYLRIYLPEQAELISVKNGDIAELESVQSRKLGKLTELSTSVEVPVEATKEVVFSYRIHKNINLEKAPVYRLYIQKQPGTEKDPFRLTFNLPAYLKIQSVNGDTKAAGKENISMQSNLSTDLQFIIEIEKK